MATKFVSKAKITQQGQVTVPLEARSDLKINIGDDLYWYEYEGTLIASKELLNHADLEKKMRGRR